MSELLETAVKREEVSLWSSRHHPHVELLMVDICPTIGRFVIPLKYFCYIFFKMLYFHLYSTLINQISVSVCDFKIKKILYECDGYSHSYIHSHTPMRYINDNNDVLIFTLYLNTNNFSLNNVCLSV